MLTPPRLILAEKENKVANLQATILPGFTRAIGLPAILEIKHMGAEGGELEGREVGTTATEAEGAVMEDGTPGVLENINFNFYVLNILK